MADASVGKPRSLLGKLGRIVGALAIVGAANAAAEPAQAASAHDFEFTAIEGGPLKLSEFRGSAVLVVNTASQCGFTGQYAGLQQLYDTYKDRGFVVLGVPSNDFGAQEPGSAQDIKAFCETNFEVAFPLTDKVAVSGDAPHPFYRWAADQLGPMAKPRWNFHKYLVAPDGKLVDWFSTVTGPTSSRVTAAIEKVLPR